MTARNPSEQTVQREIRSYVARIGFRSVHVPNGGFALSGTPRQRSATVARLKADGMVPGFPDLLVYAGFGRMGHIEVKAAEGRLSARQKEVIDWLAGQGQRVVVARSVDDVKQAFQAWGWIS